MPSRFHPITNSSWPAAIVASWNCGDSIPARSFTRSPGQEALRMSVSPGLVPRSTQGALMAPLAATARFESIAPPIMYCSRGRERIARRFIAGFKSHDRAKSRRDERKKGLLMHSFVSCLMHCVFATKERRPFIKPELQARLWPYLGGIARENKMRTLVIGPADVFSLNFGVSGLRGISSDYSHKSTIITLDSTL